jgi:two-component system OmpR family response regulator
MKVLLIEDEARIASIVCSGLGERGWQVDHCDDGQQGLERALAQSYEAIVLDLMLPGRDGLDVLKTLRAQSVQTPVILLTARNELGDRLQGLSLGADDYLAKPFYVEELAARLAALQRRLGGERQNVLKVGPVHLDQIEREVRFQGRSMELTSREYTLLAYLMRSAGTTFTRAQILEHVWGYDFDPSTNVVDVCIKRLRAKLQDMDPSLSLQTWIESVRGAGYRFRTAGEAVGLASVRPEATGSPGDPINIP